MNKADIEAIKKYDFLKTQGMPLEEMSKHVVRKIGNSGGCKVNIILPTFKRDITLKPALESALNQKTQIDYQIIVMDNAGISDTETETEKLIRNYNDDRIVYYQQDEEYVLTHKELNIHPFNSLYMVSDSEWVCMLHDDDVLAEDYLEKMCSAIEQKDDIEGLMCDLKEVRCGDEDDEPIMEFLRNKGNGNDNSGVEVKLNSEVFRITEKKHPKKYVHYILGAFMKRTKVIELGGYPCDNTIIGLDGMSDFVLAVKYAYYYRTYFLNDYLYGYRISPLSASANPNIWHDIFLCRSYFIKYLSNLYPSKEKEIIEACAEYETMDQVDGFNRNNGDYKINREGFFRDCGIYERRGIGIIEKIRKRTVRFLGNRIRQKYA